MKFLYKLRKQKWAYVLHICFGPFELDHDLVTDRVTFRCCHSDY